MSHLIYNIHLEKEVFYFEKNKELVLNLLKQKINGEITITYKEISNQTGYDKKQINRFLNQIEKKDIESLLVHGLTGKPSNNSAPQLEIDYIKGFKKQYPIITISQFQNIYNEDVIFNKEMKSVIKKHKLKLLIFSSSIDCSLCSSLYWG